MAAASSNRPGGPTFLERVDGVEEGLEEEGYLLERVADPRPGLLWVWNDDDEDEQNEEKDP